MRELLLAGKFELPSFDQFVEQWGIEYAQLAQKMMRSAWHAYLERDTKGRLSGIYWAEQFENAQVFNQILRVLSHNKWLVCTTVSKYHWSDFHINYDKLCEYLSPDELQHVRKVHKTDRYVPEFNATRSPAHLTSQNGVIRNTGLIRDGFARAKETQFGYDTEMLSKYQEAITLNVNKGMAKCRELRSSMTSTEADYDAISTDIVQKLIDQPDVYNIGNNISDSRGRAIKSGLSKVANPIGYKDFRALLVIPQ